MTVPLPDPSRHAHAVLWQQAFAAVLLVLIWTVFMYRGTAGAMAVIWWRSESFTHCLLVPPIVAWLIWRKRTQMLDDVPAPGYWTFSVTAALGLLWVLAELAAVNSVAQLSFVAILVSLVPGLLGWRVTRVIMFPLAFMFFSVPIGEFLMPLFMDWTANFTVWAVRASGIPVYRDGLQFVIPSGNWSVVEACSGIRYLIASFTVGTLYAYLNYQSTARRAAFMLVSIIVPIFANWMRAYMIVMLGHLSGNKLAVGVDHLVYGWVFFGIVILLMFALGARWAQIEPVAQAGPAPTAPAGRATTGSRFWLAALCAAVVVAIAPTWQWWTAGSASASTVRLAQPFIAPAGWALNEPGTTGFEPRFENAPAKVNLEFSRDGQTVGVYVAYYRQQDYASKLVSSNNVLVSSTDRNWSVAQSGSRSVDVSGRSTQVRTAELRRLPLDAGDANSGLMVWQTYWINGTLTSNDYLAKVYSSVHRLFGHGDDAAAIVLYARKTRDGDASAVLAEFMQQNFEAIDAALREARSRK